MYYRGYEVSRDIIIESEGIMSQLVLRGSFHRSYRRMVPCIRALSEKMSLVVRKGTLRLNGYPSNTHGQPSRRPEIVKQLIFIYKI